MANKSWRKGGLGLSGFTKSIHSVSTNPAVLQQAAQLVRAANRSPNPNLVWASAPSCPAVSALTTAAVLWPVPFHMLAAWLHVLARRA